MFFLKDRQIKHFMIKSTIGYNLGPKLGRSDVRQDLITIFKVFLTKFIKISEYFKICKCSINLIFDNVVTFL